jgi:transglutaminase-like putative cysteine protease
LALTYPFYPESSVAVGMLAVMAGLKPIEVHTYRDCMVTIFLAYFLAVTSLFDFETLSMTAFMFMSVLVTTAVLIRQNHPDGGVRGHLRLSAVMMAQAIPLMIVLFACFPRTYGSSWGLPGAGRGVTGFSSILRSGDISSLVRSDRVAFRAEFDEAIPPAGQLYWRGVVFEEFDGTVWRPAKALSWRHNQVDGDQVVTYGISLEPYDGRWLFALDLPRSAPEFAAVMGDYTLRTRRRLSTKLRYRVTSVTRYRTAENPARRRAALKLPPDFNPRTVAMAQRWKAQGTSASEIVQRALDHFSSGGFVYTLSPPRGNRHAIDDFLMDGRQGFCEHYAAAFVVLMRAAGIPARIVGGFLGGEPNPYGNYLIVRDAHAHTWAEVWLDGQGWVRFDPTLTVAPERMTLGSQGGLSIEGLATGLLQRLPPGLAGTWQAALHFWELVNSQWDFQVMGYSSDEQQGLLSRIGFDAGTLTTPVAMGLITCVFGGLLLAAVGWRRKTRGKSGRDAVQVRYAVFCSRLADIGLERRPSQGPVDYAHAVAASRQDLKQSVEAVTDLYVRLRYGGDPALETRRAFFEQVRRFKPSRSPR